MYLSDGSNIVASLQPWSYPESNGPLEACIVEADITIKLESKKTDSIRKK